jgi:flagellar basal body rod protein FlgG
MNALGQLVTADGYPLLGLNADGIEALDGAQAAPAEQQTAATPGAPTAQSAPQAPSIFAVAAQRQPAQEGAPGAAASGGSTLGPIVIGAPASKVTITPRGRIYEGETLLGAVVVAEFPDVKRLKKGANTAFINEDPNNTPVPARLSRVQQGALEQSNVNATSELVNLIKANRLFEGNMRAIKVYSDMAGKEANEVGKL